MLTKPRGEQTSKTLNYLDASFVGPYFGLFMCVWIYLRHYLNLRILYSLFTEFKTIGPYELDWEGGQYKCWISFYITLVLLASLQALNLFWLFFIIRIAYRLVVYKQAEDDRSEADESEIEEREREIQVRPRLVVVLDGGQPEDKVVHVLEVAVTFPLVAEAEHHGWYLDVGERHVIVPDRRGRDAPDVEAGDSETELREL